ncbi:dihydrodipicolinate synthase family protein [Homoserinibacter gongjuensis]|jgi:4-hydroxy-tetrahydrodipicolinate synthase|uniref:Dihydrodipicolinate synthase family protein n=1 Tax=Homoserinibacter gongjuensis TaxID=1162968 RepID=A0ABQ6JPW8_9MICO|nr:dihydrodipicolinate synthase family protein [Homoserinibacter gongjuensis]GMA90345.1 dihydrodipicolinate synthase family protein [Homoserinibacter gongjuensis]
MIDGRHLLSGLIVPIVTGLDAESRPDATLSARLLDAMADAGVTKLMVLGSNGEGPLIPTSMLRGYLEEMVQAWHDRVPLGAVVVNATAPATLEALERGALAVAAGADAVAVCAPFYFRHRDDEILEHFRRFAALEAPVVAYNIPRYVNDLTPAVIEQLPELSHVIGVKDSSGDLETLARFIALKDARPDFGVSQGGETALLAGLRMGADGIVPGTGNIAPSLAVRLLDALAVGDDAAAERAQEVTTLLTGMHRIRAGVPSVKAVLDQLGLLTPHVAPPLAPCTEAERSALAEFIAPFRAELIGGS